MRTCPADPPPRCRSERAIVFAAALTAALTPTGALHAQDPAHHPAPAHGDAWQRSVLVAGTVAVTRRAAIAGTVIYTGAPGQSGFRVEPSYRAAPWLELLVGYGETRLNAPAVDPLDRVVRGAVTLNGARGRWAGSGRSLLEIHRHAHGALTAYRPRVRADHALRSGGDAVRLFAYTEGELALRSTVPGVRTGWERVEGALGVRRPLARQLAAELFVMRSARRAHAPASTLGFQLSLDVGPVRAR